MPVIDHSPAPRFPATAVSALAIAVALAGAAPAQAQSGALALEEVVVTAQKREQNLQDVPVSVSAISAAMIEQAGIQTTEDMTRVAPSLTFTGNVDKQGQSFSLRGIGTNTFGINIEQSVAFIVDDVAAVQQGESIANLSDIARIEILRGPQSTLFGKSASAGAIVVSTRNPAEEFEGSIGGTSTSDDEYRLHSMVSGPLGDNLGYRLNAYWNDWDGNIDNLSTGDTLNGAESWGLRGKLRWFVTDNIEALLTAYYNKEEGSCCAMTQQVSSPDARLFGAIPLNREGVTPGKDNDRVRYDLPLEADTESAGGNLHLEAELGEFSLVSITAYNSWDYSRVTDVDGTDVDLAALVTAGQEHGGMYESPEIDSEFFSQEFRLVSPDYDNYDYLLGLYYADATTERYGERNIDPDLPIIQANDYAEAGTETAALFGQFNWRFSESTGVSAGLRFNHEKISADYVDFLNNGARISSSDSDDAVVGRLALQHFLADDVMLFASFATGYKGQAYDLSDFNQYKADHPVQPETSDAFELGIKSKLWNQRLLVNATAFYSIYDDFQAQSTTFDETGLLTVNVVNVGKLETSGVELESTLLLSENLSLSANAAYMDAQVNDYTGASCWPGQTEAQGCIGGNFQNIDGGKLPSAPDWKYNLMLDYQLPLPALPFDAFAGINYRWQDDVTFDINQDPNMFQGAYGIADFRMGITDKHDRYQVTAFIKNVLDKAYTSGMRNPSPLYGGADVFAQTRPRDVERYFGINAEYRF
ncbi:TonB-dependent receptor [Haliea sp. E17]|uniref:TonB-dependent receptor n=1 Tax=Haliea sp. E17 TaxID=3401576 RepID=UPI003AAA80D5